MLYPKGKIELQQDDSYIHDSPVIQECLSRQADVELINWTPRAPDMNPIENLWSVVKRTLQEKWPFDPPRNSDELWSLVSNEQDDVALSQRCIRSLIESMSRRMKTVVQAEGFWTSY
jgi:hypothetical protein